MSAVRHWRFIGRYVRIRSYVRAKMTRVDESTSPRASLGMAAAGEAGAISAYGAVARPTGPARPATETIGTGHRVTETAGTGHPVTETAGTGHPVTETAVGPQANACSLRSR
jgi:hypothetical protein